MKLVGALQSLGAGLACLGGVADAFATPENFAKLAARDPLLGLDQLLTGLVDVDQRTKNIVDPWSSPVKVDGDHEFIPPKDGDQRGPCPGLNALANHGYISRNGVTGVLEVVEAVNSVYGMGLDLATVIAAMGLVGVGNPLSLTPGFSIGGETPKSSNLLGNLLGLLGTPRGLDGSHNWIEADSSNTRDDLYMTGDASAMNMQLFLDIYENMGDHISFEDMGDRAAQRLNESIATNPQFYYGPYTGLIARNAGFLFANRLLSNHSKEFPHGGAMDKETFKSLFGVTTESDGSLKYNRGWERIPENWYRRQGDYGFVELNVDLVAWVLEHPELLSVGGNMGEVDSFTVVNIEDLTGGALSATKLLEGNNLVCFALEIVKTFAPNSLSSLFTTLATPLKIVNDAVLDPILDLGCPPMDELTAGGEDILAGLLDKFPGAKKSGFAL